MINIDKYKRYAPIVIRISMALVFLWFGINQLINPESFLGYVPQWLSSHSIQITHEHPLQLMHNIAKPSVYITIITNGIFETLFGLFLLVGLFTRISSFLLTIHLLSISLSLGYNDIMIRDLGLTIATLSIFLYGYDKISLDNKIKNKMIKILI